MSLTLIGDRHGEKSRFEEIANQFDYTLQIGDYGFQYGDITLDPKRHKFFQGNHDNYDYPLDVPHCIGDFGTYKHGGIKFFFVRGAFSIDMPYRIGHYRMTGAKSWWHQEELSLPDMINCLKAYKKAKPKYIFTHTCPSSISEIVGNSKILEQFGFPDFISKTNQLLQLMLEAHAPLVWVFGHFHRSWRRLIDKTQFICLNELETLSMEETNDN